MTMAIVFTIACILVMTMFGAMLGASEGESVELGVIFFWATTKFAILCWVIYIAVHFINKYW